MDAVITSYSQLLNAQAHPVPTTIPISGAGIFTPRLQAARSAQEVVWSILVEKVVGAPTTASLTLAFQGGFRTTRGDVTPPAGVGQGVGNRYNMTDVYQQWFTLNADRDQGFLPDGDFPPVAADQTVSSGTLSTAVASGDQIIHSVTQYPPGTTLIIDDEQFFVYGPATTADAGAHWDHPVVSHGSPNLFNANGNAASSHSNGATIHAPKAYFKRVLGGFDQRLLIVPTFTGGTNPAFRLTIDVRARG